MQPQLQGKKDEKLETKREAGSPKGETGPGRLLKMLLTTALLTGSPNTPGLWTGEPVP